MVSGDTHSIALSKGQVRRATNKGQSRLRMSVATEGAPEPGPRGAQKRPPAQTPPRLLPRVPSRVHVQFSISSPDLKHRVQVHGTWLEALKPLEARTKAGVGWGCVSL